jgi:uncharacterized membrane protein YfcA
MALDIPLVTLALLAGGGALIGFLLSVLGAGGSILLLPLLVSGAALPTKEAVPLSLLVVMLLALGNLGPCLRRRQFAPRPALQLGLPALAGSWIGGSWVKAGTVGEPVELTVFALAALTASWLMTRQGTASRERQPAVEAIVEPAWTGSGWKLIPRLLLWSGRRLLLSLPAQGVLVGLLTGIAGVGGGFAIVPALVLLAGLPMQLASCTSLLLIAVNALVAFSALGHWPAQSLPLLLPLLIGGALGALIGQRLAPHLPDRRLRQGFAALLVGSALLTGVEAVHRHGRVASEPRDQSQSSLFTQRKSTHQPRAIQS